MDENITPIRYKGKRQVRRSANVGRDSFESAYNLKVNKRKTTPINSFITFHKA